MAMGVDAFTYDGFNHLMAERMKHKTHVSIPCLNIMNTLNIPQMQIQHDKTKTNSGIRIGSSHN